MSVTPIHYPLNISDYFCSNVYQQERILNLQDMSILHVKYLFYSFYGAGMSNVKS